MRSAAIAAPSSTREAAARTPASSLFLQRKCSCGGQASSLDGECDECRAKRLQRSSIRVGASGDRFEHEANHVADAVAAGRTVTTPISRVPPSVQGYAATDASVEASALMIGDVLHSSGGTLPAGTRSVLQQRFQHDFSDVRIHTDARAAESARAVNADAYTVGHDIAFATGRYSPDSASGRHLLAHELTHVVQQEGSGPSGTTIQRQYSPMGANYGDAYANREYAKSGATKATECGKSSGCPPGFCDPYASEELARYYRTQKMWWLMAGISAAVDSRVVPLWRTHLMGGSSKKDLTAEFGKDFTHSPTTRETTQYLHLALKNAIAAKPPAAAIVPETIDIATLIPTALASLGDWGSKNQMNFNIPKDVPGNLAGGLGKNQGACPAGAMPSPQNDDRRASGTVTVIPLPDGTLFLAPAIEYTVTDTIDLCPGDCGTVLESVATVPISQFEATGISGDVPFQVDFPAPFIGALTVPAPAAPPVAAPPRASPSKKP